MKSWDYIFTVFTPTYNRAQLLSRAFQSLKAQTFRNFEYIVIDSGSDDTRKLVEKWSKEADFPVSYIWQPKRGKHVAINRAVDMARGGLFVILDDDDWLAPNALERLHYHWKSIPESLRGQYSGVVGLYACPSGEVCGTPFPSKVFDSNAVEIFTRYKVKGDLFGLVRTEVLRSFPFPEDLGSFVTEALVWNRIAKAYSERYVNEALAYKEYQPGGLTDRSIELRVGSDEAARTFYREFVELDGRYVSLLDRLKASANYVRFSMHGKVPLGKQYAETSRKAYWILSLPFGFAVYLRDKRLLAKRRTVAGDT
jgi:glycosyltransferase involved in cell wall biosynthesis